MTTVTKTIELSEVLSVYSGRPGCCCGCRGKHYYPTSMAKVANARGSTINDHQVTRIVNLLNEHRDEVQDEDDHLFLDLGQRWYIVYLKL